MIDEFAINLECTMLHVIGTPSHEIVIGQVITTYVSQDYMKDGKLDFNKFTPLLWYPEMGQYVSTGRAVGKSFGIGKGLKR
jgi:flavin reductase (DIM6/NTAB) family NADH-FMN oxidoreductase RutF